MLRPPAAAGRFYPEDPETLAQQVALFCATPQTSLAEPYGSSAPNNSRVQAIACMVPHAGYRFSGQVAGAVYRRLQLPQRFLIIGPRHYPRGNEQAILSAGAWQTPLGNVELDSDLAEQLKRACPALTEDDVAHKQEHAIEVQLPFLQSLAGDFRFVPIALGTMDFARLETLGRAIATVLSHQSDPVLIVASSDMNHYESDEITRQKDRRALDPLLQLDAHGLHSTVRREGITMCGCGPAVSTLIAAQLLGARNAELVSYATSGDINGDREEVVGYAGVVIT